MHEGHTGLIKYIWLEYLLLGTQDWLFIHYLSSNHDLLYFGGPFSYRT